MSAFIRTIALAAFFLIAVTLKSPVPGALAHGGKPHGGDGATPFVVMQKAVALYDQLLAKGKLDDTWETGLKAVTVHTQDRGGQTEWVVRFLRTQPNPEAVYIFFSADGKYVGSNFTGK